MKNSMGKEELLVYLEEMWESATIGDTWKLNTGMVQAYAKLVEIVEEYYSKLDSRNKSLGKLAKEYNVPYSLVHAIDSKLAQEPDPDTQEGVEELIKHQQGHIEAQKEILNMVPNDKVQQRYVACAEKILQLLRQKPDPVENNKTDTQEGVDEEMLKVMDDVIERYRLDCLSPVKVILEALTRIKQLLTRQPVQVDEGLINGLEHLKGWLEKRGEDVLVEHIEKTIKMLTHLSTSGNKMSDKRMVTREKIREVVSHIIFLFENEYNEDDGDTYLIEWLKELGIGVEE